MYSKRLRDIARTTSFRIALLFVVLFAAASTLVIGALYWQTVGYLASQVDGELQVQMDRWASLDQGALTRELTRRLQRDAALRQPSGVFSASGEHLAGAFNSVWQIKQYDVPFDTGLPGTDGNLHPVRALARVLDSGLVLVTGEDVQQANEFRALLLRAIAAAAALVFPAALIGAATLGLGATRRLDATARAAERIVSGRLSERLPTRGTVGDIDRLALVVNRMLDEIEHLMGEVKGVTDDVAHDLRTPLTRILAGIEHAERHALTREEYADLVAHTGTQVRLLLRMFRALLRISDIDNRVRPEDFAPVSLHRIAADALELFEPAAEEKGITLTMCTDGHGDQVLGQVDLLFDAVSNLLDNAVKFTPRDGVATLSVRSRDGEVVLSVADTGPGIPVDERESVLRRFYRCERSRHTAGNGLGLSLVAAVSRLHGMRLTIGDAHPGCIISLSVASITPGAEPSSNDKPAKSNEPTTAHRNALATS